MSLPKLSLPKLFATLLWGLVSLPPLLAQHLPGLSTSNYAGTFGAIHNPSYVADTRHGFAFNLGTVHSSINRDYFQHFPSDGLLFPLLTPYRQNLYATSLQNGSFTAGGEMNIFSEVRGPSLLLKLTASNGIAVNWRMRGFVQGAHLPGALTQLYHGVPDPAGTAPASGTVPDFFLNQNVFSELSFSYGHVVLNNKKHFAKAGATLKRLTGIHHAHLAGKDLAYSLQEQGTELGITHLDYAYGYSSHAKPFSLRNLLLGGENTGTGWGLDLGATYEFRPRYEQYKYFMNGRNRLDNEKNKYLVRVGAALLDIGSIRYNTSGGGMATGTLSGAVLTRRKMEALGNDPISALNQLFDVGSPAGPSTFISSLPRALNLDLDVRVRPSLYANVQLLQGVGPKTAQDMRQPSVLVLTPRAESEEFELALPVSFVNDYKTVLFGVGLRLGPMVFGMNNLAGFVGKNKEATTFYASLSFWNVRKKEKDRDNDGVSDKYDRCNDFPGIWEFKGCPDTDLDGIEDKVDECPTVAGVAGFKGCPDSDGDGIPDKNDACPDVAGLPEFNGCPDTDKDGVPDYEDACPTLAGSLAFNGCPDTDGDGIADDKDKCPELAGPAELGGCPDTDGDGVPDNEDACPSTSGPVAGKGCPDSDKDGVYDHEDACPTVKGSPLAKGCPDQDNDGVADKDDRCPELTGDPTNNGCPMLSLDYEVVDLYEEEAEIVQGAEDALTFNPRYTALNASSNAALDKLADLLRSKPNYRLLILELQKFSVADGETRPVDGRGRLVESYLAKKKVPLGQMVQDQTWLESAEGVKKNENSLILLRIVR